MAQYEKDFFNLAAGPGRAIPDPREDEKRAQEASARAERDLRSQMAARMVNMSMQTRAQQAQESAQLGQQQLAQQELAQRDQHFNRGLQAQQQESREQRAFQQALQEAGINAQSQEALMERTLRQRMGNKEMALARERMGQEARFGELEALHRAQAFQVGRQDRAEDVRFRDQAFRADRADTLQNRVMALSDRHRADERHREQMSLEREQLGQQTRNQDLQRSLTRFNLAQEERDRADGQRANVERLLGPHLEEFNQGNFSEEATQRVREIARMNPAMAPVIAQMLQSSDFDTAIQKNYGYDRNRPLASLGNLLRDALSGRATGVPMFGLPGVGPFTPFMDDTQEMQSAAARRLAELRALSGNAPRSEVDILAAEIDRLLQQR
jgi:hypothetical protein